MLSSPSGIHKAAKRSNPWLVQYSRPETQARDYDNLIADLVGLHNATTLSAHDKIEVAEQDFELGYEANSQQECIHSDYDAALQVIERN